jgi:outer membrane protein OmpA-like peptidoglycan-associated protein
MRLNENIFRIKEVMGLITEAEQPKVFEINLGNLFDSGKYILNQQAIASINSAILKLREFAKKTPTTPVVVSVESSESKVPNYDREKYPSTGDRNVDFTDDKKLGVGALSALRAKSIEDYLNKTLRIPNAKIDVVNKGAQGPIWDGKNANDPKYTANQYVKLFAKLNTSQPTTNLHPEIKRETVQTGTYFCDGKNSGNQISNETTYVNQCAKLPNNLKLSQITPVPGNNNKSRYMSAFEIKYGVNVTGDSYVVPRARFNFYWDSTGKKITSVTRQTYSPRTETEEPKILTEKPISATDTELKYLMGLKAGDPNGGISYYTYIKPYI